MDVVSYALSKKYTDETAVQFGGLKGAPCKIKSTEHKDGRTTIVFEWKNDSGETRESTIYVDDGTPIYTWESGNTYHYGDLVIYASAFYRCVVENSDTVFDENKFSEIGSPDGNYDLVPNKNYLPARFTAADKKLFYAYEESIFYFWNGARWVVQHEVVQYDVMPTPAVIFLDRVVQYIGTTTQSYTFGYFYKCVLVNDTYKWEAIDTQEVKELTEEQINTLLDLIQ